MTPTRALGAAVALALFALPCSIGTASAQIPETFTNLKILPKNISKTELVEIMRGFAGGLGVRCTHCHAGEDSPALEKVDFASDEREPKRIARVMLKMVREINQKLIPKTGIATPVEVRCITCHRGVRQPQTLDALMKTAVVKDGIAAGQKAYRDLRKEYYGSGAYDFRPPTLNIVAEWLAHEREDVDGAISMMSLSLEFEPNVAYSYNLLGRLQAMKGDKAAAIASYKRSLELEPGNRWVQQLLQEAEGGT